MSRHDALADRLHGAIEAGDLDGVRGCYAEDLELWMNITDETVGADEGIEILAGLLAVTATRRYEITRRVDTPTGYVQEHLLHVVGVNGAEATSPACLVVDVDDDGRIVSMREYLDSRALAAVFR